MKVHLMYPDRDFDSEAAVPPQADNLIQDLELATLFDAMAAGDTFIRPLVETALLTSLTQVETIRYRQQVFSDCQRARSAVDALYEMVVTAIEEERKQFHLGSDRASLMLSQGIDTMTILLGHMKALRRFAETATAGFESPAFLRFFRMLREELSDAYLADIAAHLKALRFEQGVLFSARLGVGNGGGDFVLRELPRRRRGAWRRFIYHQPTIQAFDVHPRDQSGGRALEEMRNRGLESAAITLGQSANHVLGFFKQLRAELAFYRGALNLQDALSARAMPTCLPVASAADGHLAASGLYDPCLCLVTKSAVVSNALKADGRALIFVTGANQGGKSTFLRGLGVAQLLMQCGLFVPAEQFTASPSSGLFTHYKREEDANMASGKFQEELLRMDAIVRQVGANGLVLFNESFAATNEREGAAIAADIIAVLVEKGIRVVFVTHFYELACAFMEPPRNDTLFLKAERGADGKRSHRIVPGRPTTTAYGRDLYARIFADLDPTSGDD